MNRFAFYAAFVASTVAGCTVGPDYRRPDISAPVAWRVAENEVAEISNVAWWDQFDDPALSHLVTTALANNLDLAVAAARVDQAFAQYGITRSALFPQVDAGGSAARERPTQTGPIPPAPILNEYTLAFSASFEIDLWGRLRRATESARARVLATDEARRTVVLTLVSAVANGYIQLRALDRQLEIARATAASLQEAAELQRKRFVEGAIAESDYRQAQSQYEAAASQVPQLERLVARQENLISVLLGANPGPIERGRTIDQLRFPAPPQALPAELLDRRPDIRRAEQSLAAANADIGVAKAAYFPRISLTGLLGVESGELSNLFKGPSRTWSYGAGVSLPVFNAGRIRSDLEGAQAAQREALAQYRQSIISAFADVDDALVDRRKFAEALGSQARYVGALGRFRDLAELRYREGAAIYLEVSSAEASFLNAQLAYVGTQAALFQSYVNLYKAMGGGWIDVAPAQVARGGAAPPRP